MTKDISFEMSFAWLVRVTKFLKQLLQTVHIDSSLLLLPPAPQSCTIFNISVVSKLYLKAAVESEKQSFITIFVASCSFKVIMLSGLKKKFFINVKSLIQTHSSNLPSNFRKLFTYHIYYTIFYVYKSICSYFNFIESNLEMPFSSIVTP